MKLSEKFIKATNELSDFDKIIPAPYFRKSFELDFVPEMAEITICGLGFYELCINGKDVTKGAMAPYISNTDHICYYDSYDITKLLEEGTNVVAVTLGNGFRNPYGGYIWDFDKMESRGPLVLALCLEAEGSGKHFEMEADESFKTHESPILVHDIRMGYTYDSTKEIPGWNLADFDDSSWNNALPAEAPKGQKCLCDTDPIVVTHEMKPCNIDYFDETYYCHESTALDAAPIEETLRKNVYVYSFPVNTSGVLKLKINGNPGQKIRLYKAELYENKRFTMFNLSFDNGGLIKRYYDHSQVDEYICKGGEEVFIPKFKYDAFQYVLVEGLTPEQATEEALTYLVMNSDIEKRADFNCSDEVLNKLYENIVRSDLANLYYFPTDCPHREKNGWTGDASVSARRMLLHLKASRTLKEWLRNIRKAQRSTGEIPGIVPTGDWGYKWGNGPSWDAVCVNLPYYIYRYDGDVDIIKENEELIVKYFEFAKTKCDEKGLVAFGLGDWVSPVRDEEGNPEAPLITTDSIELYYCARKAEHLFKEASLSESMNFVKKFADDMYKAIKDNLIDYDTMTVYGNCQTCQAFALQAGIFTEEELPKAQTKLVELVHKAGDTNTGGVLGVTYLFRALTDAGEAELAYRVVTENKCKNDFGYWVANGATSMWESFHELDASSATGYRISSRNHHFLGDIGGWFIEEFAGIKPNPNVNDITYFEISPKFIDSLDFAWGYYDSVYGRLTSKWTKDKGIVEITLDIPSGINGKVIAPEGYTFDDLSFKKDIETGKKKYILHKLRK